MNNRLQNQTNSHTTFSLNSKGLYNPDALPEFFREEEDRVWLVNLIRYRSTAILLGRGNKAKRRIHAIRHAQFLAGDDSEIFD
jgi:hypothetical protein